MLPARRRQPLPARSYQRAEAESADFRHSGRTWAFRPTRDFRAAAGRRAVYYLLIDEFAAKIVRMNETLMMNAATNPPVPVDPRPIEQVPVRKDDSPTRERK